MEEIKFKGCVSVPSIASAQPGELAVSFGFVPEAGELKRTHWPDVVNNGGTIEVFGKAPLVELEFGMVQAGMLAIADNFELPSTMVPTSAGGAGSGASTVHGSTSLEVTNAQSAAQIVAKRIGQAISAQIEAKGYFYQPFFVRYALRMADGTHSAPSSPVLMMPWMMPPCIALGSSVTAEDKSVVSLSSSSMRFFGLRCHVLGGLAEEWIGQVTGVDVFISEPIATYDADTVCEDGFVSYSQMANSSFVGIWDESGNGYAEHTIGELGLGAVKAWTFSPNTMMLQQIIDMHEFYQVAYISASQLAEGEDIDLVLPCTSADALKRRPIFNCDSLDGHCDYKPDAALNYNGLTLGAGGSIEQPKPLPLRSMAQACGEVRNVSTSICLLSRRDGIEYSTGCICTVRSLPRYLFTAVPGAYAILIRIGINTWQLPLQPHSYLDGYYWWGGIDDEVEYQSSTWVAPMTEAWHPMPNVLATYTSSLAITTVGSGQCFALQPALRAMSAGQFGDYPLYVFATDGVWAVAWRNGTYGSPQLLSHDVALSADAIAAMESGIAYATSSGVKVLAGAKTEWISTSLAADPMMGIKLPDLSLPSTVGGLKSLPSSVKLCYRDGQVWVMVDEMAYAYDTLSEQWGMVTEDDSAFVVSRPLAGPIRKICVHGLLRDKPEVYVFGSQDFSSWHLVASGKNAALAWHGTDWHYYVVAICAPDAISFSKINIAQ